MKRVIRLKESDLHRIITESVKRTLNEIGDTKRGQYMLGRLRNRQSEGGGKIFRGVSSYNDAEDYAYKANGDSYSDEYLKGFDDQRDGKNPHQVKWNYDVYKMEDMDNLGRNFIDFIEKSNGGALMQTVVDYETGNQTGQKESPLKELIPQFEEEVLGYECTPDMIDAITKAYNQWWYYAEGTLVDPEG